MADKLRILVIEDEPNMRELVQARLGHAGYEVETAQDGFQGLCKYRECKPDIVILDLMLPKLDGYTICRMMKSGPTSAIPIILFSARSAPDDARRGLDIGADAFISKPFDQATLLAKVEELLKPKLDALRGVTSSPETPAGAQAATPEPAPVTGEKQPAAAETVVEPQKSAEAPPANLPNQKAEREGAKAAPAPGEESEPPEPQIRPGPLTNGEQAARVRPVGPQDKPGQAEPGQAKPQAKGGVLKRLFGGR